MINVEPRKCRPTHLRKVGVLAAATLLLAGCEGTVTMDLAVELPADTDVRQVLANVTGLEFRVAGDTTTTLEFSEAESVVLTNYADGDTLRLFTDEELPEGTYTGVRLLFDTDADAIGSLIQASGAQFPMIAGEGAYATIDVTIDSDENSSDSLTLTLDLRQSLTFDDADDEYTLAPVLRSVRSAEAGGIQGAINAVCSASRLDTVAAVYLFQGADVAPDDRDGSGVEPYATTPVIFNASDGTFSYAFRFLPAGDYTIALACAGNEEVPSEDDGLSFKNAANVALEDDETQSHSI